MASFYITRVPLPALGMSALVLGVIALLLAFLPILGIPLSLCGIVLGCIACVASFTVPGTFLRWALAGLITCILALTINLAIYYAPTGYLNEPGVPRPWQGVPDRPYSPPPARQV
jgi:hypothetical protein